MADVIEQTKSIRQAIINIQNDVSRIRANLVEDKSSQDFHLSDEDVKALKLAAEHVIQTMKTSNIDEKMILSSKFSDESRISSSHHTNFSFLEQQKQPTHSFSSMKQTNTDESNALEYHSTASIDPHLNESDNLHNTATTLADLQSPKCLPVHPSIPINSAMPRVPSKATVIAINGDDDHEIAYDDEMSMNQRIFISADQFENIPSRIMEQFKETSSNKV